MLNYSYVSRFIFVDSPMYGSRQYHPLRHSVSNRIPAATMRRPKTAMSSFRYTTSPIHTEYDIVDEFITTPTIPKTHMPYTALRNQVRRGWDGAHYVREMSVGTGRDSMKYSQWNDISDQNFAHHVQYRVIDVILQLNIKYFLIFLVTEILHQQSTRYPLIFRGNCYFI